jgi:hypothetical protein
MPKSYSWDGGYSEIDSFSEGRRNGSVLKNTQVLGVIK